MCKPKYVLDVDNESLDIVLKYMSLELRSFTDILMWNETPLVSEKENRLSLAYQILPIRFSI